MRGNRKYYDLFLDFKGFVDFFFPQDCVLEDYSAVDIWMELHPLRRAVLRKR